MTCSFFILCLISKCDVFFWDRMMCSVVLSSWHQRCSKFLVTCAVFGEKNTGSIVAAFPQQKQGGC